MMAAVLSIILGMQLLLGDHQAAALSSRIVNLDSMTRSSIDKMLLGEGRQPPPKGPISFVPCGMPSLEDGFDWHLARIPPACRTLTEHGKILNIDSWAGSCTRAGVWQEVGLQMKLLDLRAMNDAAKEFELDVELTFYWYDPALLDYKKLLELNIDYLEMMWDPFDSFEVIDAVSFTEVPTSHVGVETKPVFDHSTGLAVSKRQRRYVITNPQWSMQRFPFDEREVKVQFYLGDRMKIPQPPQEDPGATHAAAARRLLQQGGGDQKEAAKAAAAIQAVLDKDPSLRADNCTVHPLGTVLRLHPDPDFTMSTVEQNVMYRSFSTPWAGFDIQTSATTILSAAQGADAPACGRETCGTMRLPMTRRPVPILMQSVLPMLLCLIVSYCTWYLQIGAMMPRLAMCIISFLTGVTVANLVSRRLPPRSQMCTLEWYFLYNFVLLAGMAATHCASHYMHTSGRAFHSTVLDKTMRITLPIVHAASYPFALILGFMADDTTGASAAAEALAVLVVVVSIAIVATTFYLLSRSPTEDYEGLEELNEEEAPTKVNPKETKEDARHWSTSKLSDPRSDPPHN